MRYPERTERTRLHLAQLSKFVEWAKEHPFVLLVSYPRSGRDWLSWTITSVTGRPIEDPFVADGDYAEYILFKTHGTRKEIRENASGGRYIILIRDPRDCILSDAYRRVVHDQNCPDVTRMTVSLVEKATDLACQNWPLAVDRYGKYESIIVQYEHLCLFPCQVMEAVFGFIGVPGSDADVLEAIHRRDRVKEHELCHPDPKNVKEVITRAAFPSHQARYEASCLKWQRDSFFRPRFTERLWDKLGDMMARFGYTEHGHDVAMWGTQWT